MTAAPRWKYSAAADLHAELADGDAFDQRAAETNQAKTHDFVGAPTGAMWRYW